MSATNWSVCPRCLSRVRKEIADKLAGQQKLYGKVSVEQWREIQADIDKLQANGDKIDNTLREDYWQGIGEEGEYEVSYRASCNVGGCGYAFQYYYKQQTDVEVKTKSRTTRGN